MSMHDPAACILLTHKSMAHLDLTHKSGTESCNRCRRAFVRSALKIFTQYAPFLFPPIQLQETGKFSRGLTKPYLPTAKGLASHACCG